MQKVLDIGIILLAVLHIFILYVEMFAWTKTLGKKMFRNDADFAVKTKVLAANQGLYNGFLAAGLIWSCFAEIPFDDQLKVFFLSCVFIAGIYGAYSASKKIIFVQALPAFILLSLLLFLRM